MGKGGGRAKKGQKRLLELPLATPAAKKLSIYSGGRMRFYGKNVSFCVSTTTESMKTTNIPLKSPIKLPPEMQIFFFNFQNLLVFRAFFEKSVFWENGRGRHQMGATLIHYTSIFNESQ